MRSSGNRHVEALSMVQVALQQLQDVYALVGVKEQDHARRIAVAIQVEHLRAEALKVANYARHHSP